MIVITKDIPEFLFSSAMDRLVFTTTGSSAEVTFTCGDTVILDEKYIPDSDKKITVYDLKELFEPYLLENLVEKCTYTIDDGTDSSVTGSFTVQYCAAETWLNAKNFMAGYFLTTLQGTKATAEGRKEFVHFYTEETVEVTVEADFYSAEKGLFSLTFHPEIEISLNKINTIDVSPDLFSSDTGNLLGYTVSAGSRTISFKLVQEEHTPAPALLFTNSFGVQETFYCMGQLALEPEHTFTGAYASGMFRNYEIEENRLFKANTGRMSHDMAGWADDLLRSKEIYLLDGTSTGKEVTITECESKRNNADDELPSFTFTYRYAQRNHNILNTPRAGRVFDYTYDYTFE
jgi:hypothetical protein